MEGYSEEVKGKRTPESGSLGSMFFTQMDMQCELLL